MPDRDESTVIQDLVKSIGQAGSSTLPDWEYVVSNFVWTASNVSSYEAVVYSEASAMEFDSFDNFELGNIIGNLSEELFHVQNSGWRGVKCSVARSGRFRVDYSYDLDEAIKWVGDFFEGGSSPEELIEVLRPVDL